MGFYEINTLPFSAATDFHSGTYLVVFNATKIPPHLLISHEGKVYSVSVSGRQMASPLNKLESYISRKSVPTLFIEWKLPENHSSEYFETLLQESFAPYPRLEAGKTSCLSPIRDFAAKLYGDQMNEARFIFELLPLLASANAIGKTIALHLNETESVFRFQQYNEAEIEDAIRTAENFKPEKVD